MKMRNAYYIKLGRGGCWERDSIANQKMRIGWTRQALIDINGGQWEKIAQQLKQEQPDKPQVATNDLNRLRDIAISTPEDTWITFHDAKLWWAHLKASPLEEDQTSKFRRTLEPWSDRSMNGRLLIESELPGKLAQLRGFRGTTCRVRDSDLLMRVIEGTRSRLAADIAAKRSELSLKLEAAIQQLHWKDYETLVDLVFRHAGWNRVSVLGQQAKGYDLELREPVTQDRYIVQVKSSADLPDLEQTTAGFSADDYRRIFFVVHSPSKALEEATDVPSHVEIVAPSRLAQLALEAGLSSWIENKVA
jgi:restriction endonuclease